MALTLSERQLRSMFALIRGDARRGTRWPIAGAPPRDTFKDGVSDETHLTTEEMLDMEIRLQEYLFPRNQPDHEHSIAVTK